jgi:hypothetical protein
VQKLHGRPVRLRDLADSLTQREHRCGKGVQKRHQISKDGTKR